MNVTYTRPLFQFSGFFRKKMPQDVTWEFSRIEPVPVGYEIKVETASTVWSLYVTDQGDVYVEDRGCLRRFVVPDDEWTLSALEPVLAGRGGFDVRPGIRQFTLHGKETVKLEGSY